MTENKRFYVKASTTDIGTVYGVKDKVKDDIVICNIGEYNSLVISELLNELHEENTRLKKEREQFHTFLNNAIHTERTRIGKNTLKQLREALQ